GIGVTSGAGGQIAEDVAPPPLKPLANLAGQFAGGMTPTGIAAGARIASRPIAPTIRSLVPAVTEAQQARRAAQTVINATSDPTQLRADLATLPQRGLPDSPKTTFQALGGADQGLGTLETGVSSTPEAQPRFAEVRRQQALAQNRALGAQMPANNADIPAWFRDQLRALDAAGEANLRGARGATEQAIEAQERRATSAHEAGGTVRGA